MKLVALLFVTGCAVAGADNVRGADEVAGGDKVVGGAAEVAGGDKVGGEMKTVLEEHNRLRAKHCAPELAWSADVAKVAQKWADKLASRCGLQHSGGKYGENLAAGTAEIMDPKHTVEMWYSEVEKYDFKKGGFSMDTGHFTQLVWKGTTKLGCGVAECKGLRIWVCNYDPPGNVQGEYKTNVLPASCK
jgi:uncharacterized protein YkwD